MTARCEPPEALRDVDGWHWIQHGSGGVSAAQWIPETDAWWQGPISTQATHAAQDYGWRYLAPVPAPDAVAALVEAGKLVASEFAQSHPLITALRAALSRVEGETE